MPSPGTPWVPTVPPVMLGVPDPQVRIRGCSPLITDGQGRALAESPEVWKPETGMSTLKVRTSLWDRKAASSTLPKWWTRKG